MVTTARMLMSALGDGDCLDAEVLYAITTTWMSKSAEDEEWPWVLTATTRQRAWQW